MEYQNSKIMAEAYERHTGSSEVMSPPSASCQMLISNPPLSPLGGMGSGGLGTSSTGVMGARAMAHESIEEEDQEVEYPEHEEQRDRDKLTLNRNQLLEDDSLA